MDGGLEVDDRGTPPTPRVLVDRVVAAVRAFAGRPAMPVSLLLTDDAEIGRIHGEFMGDPSPTDVISFPLDDGVDLVVSVECAHREAAARGTDPDAELALYIVHGMLHACGYDDIDAVDRRRMRAAERAVLDGLGLVVEPVDDADA